MRRTAAVLRQSAASASQPFTGRYGNVRNALTYRPAAAKVHATFERRCSVLARITGAVVAFRDWVACWPASCSAEGLLWGEEPSQMQYGSTEADDSISGLHDAA